VKKVLYFVLPLVLILGACATKAPKPEIKKTQLEVRELQTRTYDTKDVKMVMKAVMHALQDDSFLIQQADIDLGLLTAQKEVDLEKVSEEGEGEEDEFSWGQALAIGAAVVAIGAAIVILGNKNDSDNGSDVHIGGPPIGNSEQPTIEKTALTEASANISEFGDQTRVRINFRLKILDNKGGTAEVKQIDDLKFYQTFFSKVDKAVFLGKEDLQ